MKYGRFPLISRHYHNLQLLLLALQSLVELSLFSLPLPINQYVVRNKVSPSPGDLGWCLVIFRSMQYLLKKIRASVKEVVRVVHLQFRH
jgi:hypothetical protein